MNNDENVALKIEHVTKNFILPHQKASTIKSVFINPFVRYDKEKQLAVNDVSFEVKKGEFFGIVGRNGSGKSTLLKCIAGIYKPDRGKITINGSLVPFIELGVGFNSDLSGRDNVFLNGALLGFSRKEMMEMYDEIVEFAEIEKFMDQKLKNYSSGMQVRLAFSIAIRAKSDILLLDEVLAVGDSAFQRKCYDYFASLKRDKKTIILVSHSMSAIEKFCDKALLLEAGKIVKVGSSTKIAGMYDDMFLKEEAEKNKEGADNSTAASSNTLDSTAIEKIKVFTTQSGKSTNSIKAFEDFSICVQIKSKLNIEKANVGISIQNSEGNILFAADTIKKLKPFKVNKNSIKEINFNLENIFTNGTYRINISLSEYQDDPAGKGLLKRRNAAHFTVFGVHDHEQSLTHPKNEILIKK